MKPTIIYIYIFDTLSDWEIGYITAGINNPMMQVEPGKYQLRTFSIDGEAIRTMGGLQIVPDLSLAEVSASNAAMLIIPGGTSWNAGENHEASLLARDFHDAHIPVAAICGATLGLAKVGMLNSTAHASNSKDYILTSRYEGSDNYKNVLAISDNGIITASGTASLEFSREIFKALGLYTDSVLEAWYELFKTSAPEAFAKLMTAVEKQ